jgi:glycosyltransferase involved in cell wall biosynthesis
MSPRVSVIIPVHNGAHSLGACLGALEGQTLARADFEVIVVDNGSSDDLAPVQALFPAVHWLREGVVGSYAARNTGLRHARGEFLAFTDADCVPEAAWLERGVAALAAGPGTVIGGEVPFLNPVGRELNSYELLETVMFGLGDIRRLIEERGFAITANLFTSRAVFGRVGEFDAQLKSAGDREWVLRAVAKGEILRYGGDVIVRHPRRSTRAAFFRKQRRLVGGRMDLLRRSRPSLGAVLHDLRLVSLLDPRVYVVAFGDPRPKGLGRRIRFAGVVLLVSLFTTAEKLRLLLGGKPGRG